MDREPEKFGTPVRFPAKGTAQNGTLVQPQTHYAKAGDVSIVQFG